MVQPAYTWTVHDDEPARCPSRFDIAAYPAGRPVVFACGRPAGHDGPHECQEGSFVGGNGWRLTWGADVVQR